MTRTTWRRLAALIFGHSTLRSIEAKLVVLLTLSATIAVALAVGIMSVLHYRHARTENDQRMRALIGLVADSVGIPLAMRDRQVIDSALLSLRASQDVRAASVVEPDGKILASYTADPIAAAALRQAVQLRPNHRASDVDIRNATHFDDLVLLTKRIGPAEQPLGHVVLVVLDDELKHMRFQLGWLSVALIALMALLTLAISQYVQKLITAPLLKLTHVMDRASRTGDFSQRCNRQGDDEIGALTEAFNTMQAQAEIRDRWLARYNEELEHTVRERTQQLAQSVQQLQDEKQRVELANASKSRFLAIISHEIRTPLNGVQGMTELLSQTPLLAQQQQMVGAIRRSSDTLLSMLNSVLDYSKLEAGHLSVQAADLSLRPLVQDLVELFAAQADHKGLQLRWEVSEHVPDRLQTDPTRLRQILVNLLANALKFTQAGSVELAIELASPPSQPCLDALSLRITVTDTGIGIRADDLDRIFQPFCQADESTSRRYGGAGLGLAISKDLAELLGGSLSVHSVWGQGSRFELRIPVKPASDSANTAPLDVAPRLTKDRTTASYPPLGLHVLVVDDDAINQSITAGLLGQLGCTAHCVSGGHSALDQLEQRHVDAVLMDCQMPDMDGYDTTRRWRQREAELGVSPIPIIALTADALSTNQAKCASAGMQGYLCKPCSTGELRAMLCEAITGLGLPLAAPAPTAPQAIEADQATATTETQARRALQFDDRTVHTILTFDAMRQTDRFHALVDDFCADAMRRWDEAMHASATGDYALAHRHLHTLKSSSASLGLISLSQLLAELDQRASQQRDAELKRWNDEFQRQLWAAAGWLRDIGPKDQTDVGRGLRQVCAPPLNASPQRAATSLHHHQPDTASA